MVSFLLLGFSLLSFRVTLMAYRANVDVLASSAGLESKAQAKKRLKLSEKVKQKALGSTLKRVVPAPNLVYKGSRAGVTAVIRFVDFLIVAWALAVSALLAFVAAILILVVAVVGGVSSGAIDIWDIGATTRSSSTETSSGAETKKTTSKKGSGSVPDGMDSEEWAKADDIGQKFAATAIEAAIMDFPESGRASDNINNGKLVYRQGNTWSGVYDCSTFISAVYEANGYRHDGSKRSGSPYDFDTMKKSNLEQYKTSGMTYGYIQQNRSDSIVTKMNASGWEEKLVPGDIMVSGVHIATYVGKNDAGDRVVAHSGSPTADVFYDVALTKPGKQVGLKKLDNSMAYSRSVIIYRPGDFVGS